MFKEKFKETMKVNTVVMINSIPHLITKKEDKEIGKMPTKEEVKQMFFSLNADSAYRPDGFLG